MILTIPAEPVVLVGQLQGSFIASFLLGWGVTTAAGLASYPLDTIRRRMMMTSGGTVHYKSMFDAGSQIIAKEGTRSLFKGAGANILRGVAGAGVLSLYDQLQVLMFGKVYSGGTSCLSYKSHTLYSHKFQQDRKRHIQRKAQEGGLVPPNSRTNRGRVWFHATIVDLLVCCHGRLLHYAFEAYCFLFFPQDCTFVSSFFPFNIIPLSYSFLRDH